MKHFILTAALSVAATLSQAAPASYAIDPSHTFVTYEIGHFGTSTNRGRFDKKEGSVQFDRAAKTGRVEVSFDIASVSTGFAPMNSHLLSAELLNAEKFPTAKFVGDKFVFNGDKVGEVQGQLTLMGKTNPVTLKATNFNCYDNPMLKREVCGGDFEATIDRSQWGVDYGLAWGFPKNVKLIIQVEAVKQ
ncbi:YceI family protein [Roseateles oligotrophus]|uniref:YceI family protein n=1 Tax=Roseateles oligotrophus TaxID=1769250 RepID=A0ABT2YBF8_9BURK|nr:YceI family protein [Roseateles oligotrophus]MCV2367519.1 YceI family protein [Roseateles oligotrophus]